MGEDDFLFEPETLQVFGDLTISQQYELAKASLDVKRSIREHFRTHPEDKRSKNVLREMRLAAKVKQKAEADSTTKQTPEAGSSAKQRPEACSAIELENALAKILPIASTSFETMEESDRAQILSWLDAAPKSVGVIRLFQQG